MIDRQNIGSAPGSPQSAPASPQGESARRLLSIRGYARERGVDDKTVRKAIAAGKIPMVDGKIDPVVADAAWARNRDAGQESKLADAAIHHAAIHQPAPAASPVSVTPVVTEPPSKKPVEPSQPEFELAPLTQARIRNTEESTAIKEITRRKLEGGLLEAEEVERTWGELLQVLKDRLRLIPDNLAPALAACTEEAECRSLLMREVLSALGALSKSVTEMVA